jgi:hypothetical protein
MRLPYKVQQDEADAQAAVTFIAPDECLTYNVAPGVDGFEAEYDRATGQELSDFTNGQHQGAPADGGAVPPSRVTTTCSSSEPTTAPRA